MENMYRNLHFISLSEEEKNGVITYSAKIIHLGLKQLRNVKESTYTKNIVGLDKILVSKFIEEQFKKWDEKWYGAYPGPICDYDANKPTSPTGTPWIELELHRNEIARKYYRWKKIEHITMEMLFTKHIPTYEQFFTLTPSSQNDD